MEELLGSQDVGTVTVRNEAELFGKFRPAPEGHAHGQDAGADAAVVRDPVTEDRAGSSIDNKPEKAFDTADFDIGLISDKCAGAVVIIVIDERFDHESSSPGVVGNLLMRDGNAVEIQKSLGRLSKRKTKIHMHGETQSHDVRVEVPEAQRGGILRKGAQINLKEIDGKFPIQVMELVLVLFGAFIFRNFLQTIKVVGALWVHTFVNDEELSVFDGHQGVSTEGAAKDHVAINGIGIGKEGIAADLAEELSFRTVILV